MTATDELRKLLDERGVKHEDKHTELVPGISDWDSTWWRGIAGLEFHAVGDETFGREGCVYINGTYLTPEQAIAATLGRRECKLRDCEGSFSAVNRPVWLCDCGAFMTQYTDATTYHKPRFCPNCGRKVKQ